MAAPAGAAARRLRRASGRYDGRGSLRGSPRRALLSTTAGPTARVGRAACPPTRSDHSAPIEPRQADARRTGGSLLVIRLGLWRESIDSNRASAAAGKEYFARTGTEAVWDQNLHAMDYLVYAHLQGGQDQEAKRVADEVCSSSSTNPPRH